MVGSVRKVFIKPARGAPITFEHYNRIAQRVRGESANLVGIGEIDRMFGRGKIKVSETPKGDAEPVISNNLREKVLNAYNYIASVYDYSNHDVGFGEKRSQIDDEPGKTRIFEYEHEFNSTLLFAMLTSLNFGTLLFQGSPGTGKTTAAEVIGQVLFGMDLKEVQSATIYGHPNLTEEKMTASYAIEALMAYKKVVEPTLWVTAASRILDEFNRIPPETLSILYQAIDRRFVTYGGVRIPIPAGPCFATMNMSDAGTFQVPPPAMDRFSVSVPAIGVNPYNTEMVAFRDPEYEKGLDKSSMRLEADKDGNPIEIRQIQDEIRDILIDPEVNFKFKYLISVLRSCKYAGNIWHNRQKSFIGLTPKDLCSGKCEFGQSGHLCGWVQEAGLYTRSVIAFYEYSKSLAWLAGKGEVSDEIAQIVWRHVVNHRLSASELATKLDKAGDDESVDPSLFTHDRHSFANAMWERAANDIQNDDTLKDIRDFLNGELMDDEMSREKKITRINELIEGAAKMNNVAKWDLITHLRDTRKKLEDMLRGA